MLSCLGQLALDLHREEGKMFGCIDPHSSDMMLCAAYLYLLCLLLFLLAVFGSVKLYFLCRKVKFESNVDLTGKVILITGGNTGIGKEYVGDIAKRNGKIIMACRDVERGLHCAREISTENANCGPIFVEKCDLTSFESVATFCELIRAREPLIDVLVCFAAAVGHNSDNAAHPLTDNGLERQFQANYLSHFLMIHLLMDLLKRSPQARIILTGSNAHLMGRIDVENISRMEHYRKSTFKTYGDSKLALVMLTKELALRLASTPSITVNAFHPGTILTNGIRYLPTNHLKVFLKMLAFFYSKTPKDGAQDMLYLTLSDDVTNTSGQYFSECVKTTTSQLADDAVLRAHLWDLSVSLVRPWLGQVEPISESRRH